MGPTICAQPQKDPQNAIPRTESKPIYYIKAGPGTQPGDLMYQFHS